MTTLERLAAIEPIYIDGQPWYKMDDLRTALRVLKMSTARIMDKSHWQRYLVRSRDWRIPSYTVIIVDRHGAFRLIVAYTHEPTPVHLLMQTLPT